MENHGQKRIDTLIDDIYKVVSEDRAAEGVDLEAEIEKFGEACKELMRNKFSESKQFDGRTLRLSNIGRDDKYLWHRCNTDHQEDFQPHTLVKFMYGHLIEEMLLLLVRLSGHDVANEQKTVHVAGIRGSMDCTIDGTVIDVKSTSTFGFKKFKEGTLAMDDPFGYVAQAKAYAHAMGQKKYGWLAMDKQNGHLCTLVYDEEDTQAPVHEHINWDIEEHIERVKKLVELPEPPQNCASPVPDGKSGNLKLSTKCSYCPYKEHCYENLRVFAYSTGPKFLVHVEKEPKVNEIPPEEGF